MKKNLYDYFYGNMSPEDQARTQKAICESASDGNIDREMREIFDDCFKSVPRKKSLALRAVPYIISAVAVCAAIICIPKVYDMGIRSGEQKIASIEWMEETVPSGGEKTVTLSDGTVMHLNSCSRITYPKTFSGDSRNVFISGEAFVKVAKDPAHPFVINSADVKITVLGTTFNFKNFSDCRNVELLLMEGCVKASVTTSSGEKEVRLSPGDKMRFDRVREKIDLERFSPTKYKAFYENHSLHFFDVEMIDIARELERRFNQTIVVKDPALASRRFFAIFTNNESLDEILRAMNTDNRMKVTKSRGIIYLQSN